MEKEWICRTSIYEVNIRQYTAEGTFDAFRPHLARLKRMGVQTLWFMPVTPIAQLNRKGSLGSPYACSDYCAINPEFGTEAGFRDLVREARALGFRVVIDWVANHTGWDHVWTHPHPEWYRHEPSGEFKKASGMDDIIELDYDQPALRRAMIEAMRWWVQTFDIDGFRCDLASWVSLDFWREAKAALDRLKPLFWLAEADALDHPEYMEVFDAAYSWTWMHRSAEAIPHSLPLKELLPVLDRYRQAPGLPAWFTSNHDENTWNGTEFEKYGEAADMLAVFSFTWPGLPLLYSGQEIPNQRRLAFFETDPLHWPPVLSHEAFFRALLELRANEPALHARAECIRVHTSADEKLLCYLRRAEAGELLIVLNFSAQPVWADLYDASVQGGFRAVFGGSTRVFGTQRSLRLPAWGYEIFLRERDIR